MVSYSLHLLLPLLLQVIFVMTQNQVGRLQCMPPLLQLHWVIAGFHLGQWIIWVSGADLVSTLMCA